MTLSSDQLQVLTKAYETCQDLAKSNAEACWSVRSWGLGIWAALVAYAFDKDTPAIMVVAGIVLVFIFFMELAIRQVQYAFIRRALEIEDSLNDVLVGGSVRLPASGVSTNIETPTLGDLGRLLSVKRWLVWFPYLMLAFSTYIAFRVTSSIT